MPPDPAFSPVPRMALRLLGGFGLTGVDGRPVELPTRKARLLLAFLALPAGVAQQREKLTSLFWGDRSDGQARGSLRHALVALRATLGGEALGVTRETVELRPGVLHVDVDDLAAGDDDPSAQVVQAASSGDLLEGLSLASEGLMEWLAFERARCRSLAASVLRRAALARQRGGDQASAIALAQRLVALDPLREQSHRLLMELFAASGERSQAMAQFQALKELLKRELAVDPAAETMDLARRLAVAASPAEPLHTAAPVIFAPARTSERFSLAVLPFVSISNDPDQRFVAEGFSEDLITELSRLKDFDVIARQSSYQFSGRVESAAASAAELGARFAVVGSLRSAGGRIRVTTQLIDAGGNRCIWAECYDRTLDDLFAVQDEIVRQVAGSVDAEIRQEERERAARAHPQSLDAWALFHRGLWHAYRFAREDIEAAEELFRRSIAEAPGFALPHGGLGYAALVRVMWFYATDPAATVAAGIAHAVRGVALDDGNAFCHGVLGRLCATAGDVERALHHLAIAVDRNPSFAPGHYGRAQALCWAGRPGEALASVNEALRLSPKDPLTAMILTLRAFCHYCAGSLAEAVADARHATQMHAREVWSRLLLAAALVETGDMAAARAAVAEARGIVPGLSVQGYLAVVRHAPADVLARGAGSLRAAGLPEG